MHVVSSVKDECTMVQDPFDLTLEFDRAVRIRVRSSMWPVGHVVELLRRVCGCGNLVDVFPFLMQTLTGYRIRRKLGFTFYHDPRPDQVWSSQYGTRCQKNLTMASGSVDA